MSYRHKDDNVWSPKVEPFSTNTDFIGMVHTLMPKIVPSITQVPFTFYMAAGGNVGADGADPAQIELRNIHPMMGNNFTSYAFNILVIGDAVNGFSRDENAPDDLFNNILEGDRADAYSLGEAFPNPTSNEITFRFSLLQPAHTTLVITNVIGQTIATVLDQFCNDNNYTVKFDTGKLPIGTYYYTLTSGSKIETKMFNVVR
jgi:hypothetical protein